jgi:hypothetical protein
METFAGAKVEESFIRLADPIKPSAERIATSVFLPA